MTFVKLGFLCNFIAIFVVTPCFNRHIAYATLSNIWGISVKNYLDKYVMVVVYYFVIVFVVTPFMGLSSVTIKRKVCYVQISSWYVTLYDNLWLCQKQC